MTMAIIANTGKDKGWLNDKGMSVEIVNGHDNKPDSGSITIRFEFGGNTTVGDVIFSALANTIEKHTGRRI